jgi:hypothetical protein
MTPRMAWAFRRALLALLLATASAASASTSKPGTTNVTPSVPDTLDPFDLSRIDTSTAADSDDFAAPEPSTPSPAALAPDAPEAPPEPSSQLKSDLTGIPAGVDTMLIPTLGLLPLAIRGGGVDSAERASIEAAIRLGASESGLYRVSSAEETARRLVGGGSSGGSPSRDCFTERCQSLAAAKLGTRLALSAQFSGGDSALFLKLVLMEAATGKVRRALQAWIPPLPDSVVPFARAAAASLIFGRPDTTRDYGSDGSGRAGMVFASGAWSRISWLNPRDSVDNRRGFRWAGSALLAAATGLAWAEGQLIQRDDNGVSPQRPLLDGDGPTSYLRGFFAAPTLGARYAAMGGAGIAQVNNGLSLLMNPAGVAGLDYENAVAAKRTLPDGTPSLFLGYAGPLYGKWSQGLGVQYEGDALASETTVDGALGYDLSAWGRAWDGIKAGVQLKLYFAEVGRSGTGADRSTGHSVGAGLDVGLQAHLNDKITAALAVRDIVSLLHHTNTYTDQGQNEILPPEYRVGAAYRASPSLILLMDGQKGIIADQADHVRLGAEKIAFGFLAMRCGLHQIFGSEAVRKLTAGFGIDTDGLGEGAWKTKVSINYGYEFGLNEDQPLAGGQQFSLDMGF